MTLRLSADNNYKIQGRSLGSKTLATNLRTCPKGLEKRLVILNENLDPQTHSHRIQKHIKAYCHKGLKKKKKKSKLSLFGAKNAKIIVTTLSRICRFITRGHPDRILPTALELLPNLTLKSSFKTDSWGNPDQLV